MSEIEKTQNNVLTLEPETKTDQETLDRSESLNDEEIREIVENFLVSLDDEPNDKEAELSYEEIANVFLDAHTDRVEELQQEKRGLILEMFLEKPAEAFRSEFTQLQRLYKGRTETRPEDSLGSKSTEFCTADHEKERADYLFRHSVKGDREKFEATKVYNLFGTPDTITVSLMDDEFHVIKQAYKRGEYYDLELEGEDRESVLAQLFYDTIKASALQMERTPEELEENDHLAMGYLATVRRNDYIQY